MKCLTQFRLSGWLILTALASPGQTPPPAPIPAPQIAERYTQTSAILRAATARTGVDATLNAIRKDLPGLIIGIQDLSAFTHSSLALPTTSDSTDSLRANWQPVNTQLQLWSSQLRALADQLDADNRAIVREEALWNATLQSADSAKLPEPVKLVVTQTWNALRAASQPLADRRAQVIVLQSELAEQSIRLQSSLDEIDRAERFQRRELFSFDSVPIWRFLEEAASRSAAQGNARGFFEYSAQSPQLRHLAALQIRLYLAAFIASIVIAWILLRLLRKRNAGVWETSSDPNIQALALALRRPVSCAVFLAAALNAAVLSDPPSWAVAFAGLSLLVPSLRLLPGLIANSLEHAVYLLVVAFVSGQMLAMIPNSSIWYRPSWLALQVATSILLWWLRGVLHARPGGSGLWLPFLRILTFVGLGASLASVLCNVFGLVQLGQWLIQSVLASYYTAGIVRGIVVLLTGLLAAGLRADTVQNIPALATRSAAIEARVMNTLRVVSALSFLAVLLYVVGLWNPFQTRLDEVLDASFAMGAISISLRRLLAFAFAIVLAFVISASLRVLMETTVYPHTRYQPGERDAFSKIIHYGVLVIGFLFAFAAAGVQLSNIAILAGGLSVGIGLGLQQLVNNFVSGLILLFERPLQVGDLIAIGPTTGIVRNIGMRASVIRTFDGADVTVPNGDLLSGGVSNWSRDDARRRSEVKVRTAQEANPEEVIRVLLSLAKAHPGIAQESDITAVLDGFGDNSQDFTLRFWTEKPVALAVASEIRSQIVEAFRAAQIELAKPSSTPSGPRPA